ncbi:MAG TPA: organic solvent tolerance protein OstA [Spirochaetaceae bacterium]|jgi:lipopolysaccharide export system protein LptA|nr:organic solvent tolerance protein OstA [Spirochaetaceae bacterium]
MRAAKLFLFCLSLLLAAALYAEDFSFSAATMSGSMSKGQERVILEGKALVITGSMTIRADRIELYGEDFRYVSCRGAVAVEDPERGLRLSTGIFYYDRQDKLTRLSGPSVMEDLKNGVVIKGDYIEHDDAKDLAIIQINARILKDRIATRSEFARFDRAANTLELSGSPYVKRGDDEYRARFISVQLDTENIVLDGAVSGRVNASSSGVNKESGAQPGAAATGGTP